MVSCPMLPANQVIGGLDSMGLAGHALASVCSLWRMSGLRTLPDEQTQALRALLTRRRQVVVMLAAEKNRLRSPPGPVLAGPESLSGSQEPAQLLLRKGKRLTLGPASSLLIAGG